MHTRSRRAKHLNCMARATRHGIESKCIKRRGVDQYASGSKDVASTPQTRGGQKRPSHTHEASRMHDETRWTDK